MSQGGGGPVRYAEHECYLSSGSADPRACSPDQYRHLLAARALLQGSAMWSPRDDVGASVLSRRMVVVHEHQWGEWRDAPERFREHQRPHVRRCRVVGCGAADRCYPYEHCQTEEKWDWRPGVVTRLDGSKLDVMIACHGTDVVTDARTPRGLHMRDLDGNVVRLADRESVLVTTS